MYEVAASDLKKLDSSPNVEFPSELSPYELADKVTVALTISAEGKVTKARVTSGKTPVLREEVEKTVKKWAFEPYLVNGAPVPVRSEFTFTFDNTLDRYRDPVGDIPVHVDENAGRGFLVKKVPPQYPKAARDGSVQGQVKLRAIIGKDGHVQRLHIISGHPLLAPAAFNAVHQWEYKPYVVNGKTVTMDVTITVSFTLSG